MDVLVDKQSKSYEYLSRYSGLTYYYNTQDDKYIYGLSSQLDTDVIYVAHHVAQDDTLDSLSFKYYGRPDLYWIIADFNRITDCMIELYQNYDIIKIPSLSEIKYKD